MRPIVVRDIVPGTRVHEPIIFTVDDDLSEDLWLAATSDGRRVVCQRLRCGDAAGRTTFVASVSFEGEVSLTLLSPHKGYVRGIQELERTEADGFVRLDTGYFDLELCTGTAGGMGSSKWGIRHFRGQHEDVDLILDGNNSIGGFYGPFFTPENGLVNPPEHSIVEIEVVERGPILHRYRMHGTVPDGLLPELRSKRFEIDWIFSYGTPFFQRAYRIDPFDTTISGQRVHDLITVGDEFEAGKGRLVFDRFSTYRETRYRGGDPYARILADEVAATLNRLARTSPKRSLDKYRRGLDGEFVDAHWDLYWQIFSARTLALSESELKACLLRVRERAGAALADEVGRGWKTQKIDESTDVSREADETIFPGPATKTVEFHSKLGRAMVWYTSRPATSLQIVQRRQSGWANWGTNAENELPALPNGTVIKTAYGAFAGVWKRIADQMETPPEVVGRGLSV